MDELAVGGRRVGLWGASEPANLEVEENGSPRGRDQRVVQAELLPLETQA